MCDFHSICVRVDGAIAHTADNSHSGAVQAFGWTENDTMSDMRGKPRFVEVEWNCRGEYPGAEHISRGKINATQKRAIDKHYAMLRKALAGNMSALKPFAADSNYDDVVTAALLSGCVKDMAPLVAMLCAPKKCGRAAARGAARVDTYGSSRDPFASNISHGANAHNISIGHGASNTSNGKEAHNISCGAVARNSSNGSKANNASRGAGARNSSNGDLAHNTSRGANACNVSGGDLVHNTSHGANARNVSCGDFSHNTSRCAGAMNSSIGKGASNTSNGKEAHNTSCGDSTSNTSHGANAHNISIGHGTTNEARGSNCVCVAVGCNSRVKVGKNGAFALTWHDGKRHRIVTGHAGEDGIEPDVWYTLDSKGRIIRPVGQP